MFDPLKGVLSHGWDVLALGWAAFSPAAAGLGLLGMGFAAFGLFGLALFPVVAALIPDFVKRAIVITGVVLLASAGLWQSCRAKTMHDAFKIVAAKALAAEKKRTEAAVKIRDQIAAQATADHAALAADNAKLKDLLDDASKDKDRARVCVDRGTARRLRAL